MAIRYVVGVSCEGSSCPLSLSTGKWRRPEVSWWGPHLVQAARITCCWISKGHQLSHCQPWGCVANRGWNCAAWQTWLVRGPEPSWTCSWKSIWPWSARWMYYCSVPESSCPWTDPPDGQGHGDGIQLSPVNVHEPVPEVGVWKLTLTPMPLKIATEANVTGIGGELTFCTGEPVGLVQ